MPLFSHGTLRNKFLFIRVYLVCGVLLQQQAISTEMNNIDKILMLAEQSFQLEKTKQQQQNATMSKRNNREDI